eukprot:6212770-Pleurochrysis_carterae.AAC.2
MLTWDRKWFNFAHGRLLCESLGCVLVGVSKAPPLSVSEAHPLTASKAQPLSASEARNPFHVSASFFANIQLTFWNPSELPNSLETHAIIGKFLWTFAEGIWETQTVNTRCKAAPFADERPLHHQSSWVKSGLTV